MDGSVHCNTHCETKESIVPSISFLGNVAVLFTVLRGHVLQCKTSIFFFLLKSKLWINHKRDLHVHYMRCETVYTGSPQTSRELVGRSCSVRGQGHSKLWEKGEKCFLKKLYRTNHGKESLSCLFFFYISVTLLSFMWSFYCQVVWPQLLHHSIKCAPASPFGVWNEIFCATLWSSDYSLYWKSVSAPL